MIGVATSATTERRESPTQVRETKVNSQEAVSLDTAVVCCAERVGRGGAAVV